MRDNSTHYLRRDSAVSSDFHNQVRGFNSELYLSVALPVGSLVGAFAYINTYRHLSSPRVEILRSDFALKHLASLAGGAFVIFCFALPAVIVEVIKSFHW